MDKSKWEVGVPTQHFKNENKDKVCKYLECKEIKKEEFEVK